MGEGGGGALYGAGGVVFGEDTANRKAPTGAERGVLRDSDHLSFTPKGTRRQLSRQRLIIEQYRV